MIDIKGFTPIFCAMEYTDENLLITGKAGTGKSTLLRDFVDKTKKEVVVLAPTGIAAINVEGQTIHSFFQLPPKIPTKEDIDKKRFEALYRAVDTIIIDEISMVRADIFDAMDKIMKKCNDNNLPFGGKQVIMIGDLFQLPPVVTNSEKPFLQEQGYSHAYFFSSFAYKDLDARIIIRDQVYRQSDKDFVRVLNSIRTGDVGRDDLAYLNERVGEPDDHLILTTTRYLAGEYNRRGLDRLESELHTFKAELSGDFKENEAPGDMVLSVKVGARIICTKNDEGGRYVNGSLGTVTNIGDETIEIDLEGDKILLKKERWKKYKYTYDFTNREIVAKEAGTFLQFPIKLAWALTIHKSQGQTIDKLYVDLSANPWETGQTYVALSRCRSYDNLLLKRPLDMRDIKVDLTVERFFNQYNPFQGETCSFTIDTDENFLDQVHKTALDMFSDVTDFDGRFVREGKKFSITEYNGMKCAICQYFLNMISEGQVHFDNCRKGKKDSELIATKEQEGDIYMQLFKGIKEGVVSESDIRENKVLNSDDKETLLDILNG